MRGKTEEKEKRVGVSEVCFEEEGALEKDEEEEDEK